MPRMIRTDGAGLVSLEMSRWSLHLGVRRGFRLWGHKPFDGFLEEWGLGPLLLVCWP